MARIVVGSALARWIGDSSGAGELVLEQPGATLSEVLDRLFHVHPALRGYVLDDRGAIRHHVALFVDGRALLDKTRLDKAIAADAEVYLMQALSGG